MLNSVQVAHVKMEERVLKMDRMVTTVYVLVTGKERIVKMVS